MKGNDESVAIIFFSSSNGCQPACAVSRRTKPAADAAAPQRGTTELASRRLTDKINLKIWSFSHWIQV